MCACVVYGCVLASGYVSQIMGVWRAEVYVSCVSLSRSTPLCETGSLELADWLGWLAVYHRDPSVAAPPALESGVYHHTRICTWVLGIPLRFWCIHIKHFTHWANPSVIKIIYTHVHNHIHNIYMYIHTYKNVFMHWLFSHKTLLQIWRSQHLLRLANQQILLEHVFPNKKVPLNHYYRHSVRFRKNAPCGQLSASSPTGCLPTPSSSCP